MSPRRAPSAPPTIPGFTHVSLLGTGGFADVFLYEQQRPRRKVAVKVLLADMLTPEARRQFDNEADLMAQLSTHPSIVTIYEAGIATDGRPYLAMEYCPGRNLGERYRRDPFSVADALRVGVLVAGAVETAHRAGILHRDIKPANVLVTEYNNPALTDFGISATIEGGKTEAEGMSIPWSPPESFADTGESGVWTDVWALAATAYSLLAGRSPFEVPGGPNGSADLIARIQSAPLPRIGRGDVPDSLERVLSTAMAKSPPSRYPSAQAFARALQQIQGELGLAVTPLAVNDDVLVARADHDDGETGTRIRKPVSIDPTGGTGPRRHGGEGAGRAGPEQVLEPTGPRPGTGTSIRPVPSDTVLRGATPSPAAPPTPVRPAPDWGESPSAPPVETTVRRRGSEAEAASDLDGVAPQPKRRNWFVAAALAVAAAVVVIVVTVGDPPEAEQDAELRAGEPIDAVGAIVPAPVDLEGVVEGDEVVFTWANPDPEEGDTYLYRVLDDFGNGDFRATPEPSATVPGAPDGRTCVEVIISRSGKPSIEPAQACVP